jgi:hypothetical protein
LTTVASSGPAGHRAALQKQKEPNRPQKPNSAPYYPVANLIQKLPAR